MRESLLVELRTEELPPKALQVLAKAFSDGVLAGLAEAKFVESAMTTKILATPRRLAILVPDVAAVASDQAVERKGPYVAQGLDANGQPAPALQGFLRSCGATFDQLTRGQDAKGEFFIYRSMKTGAPLAAHLATIVSAALNKLPTPKVMRWGDKETQFVRPVHGLMMMHGKQVVQGEVLGLLSGDRTLGHRFLGVGEVRIRTAADYLQQMEMEGRSIVDFHTRRERILSELQRAANKNNAVLSPDIAPLLDEVTALVEFPAVYTGQFDPAFLAVPQECLILSMKQHQKYFPLLDSGGKLLARFLIVSNLKTDDPSNIIHGNERVLRARLSDAKFFFDQDRKRRLEQRVPQLAHVVYHNKLGSQLERVERIQQLAGFIATQLGANIEHTRRAAYLSKADLLTDMVSEFPELQGVMGQYYALHDGEPEAVARAVEAHYHPRFANDTLPDDAVACAVALADKVDTLVGIYGVGLIPTGDKDPFGLRRLALGALRILSEKSLALDVKELLQHSRSLFDGKNISATVVDELHGFMLDRLRSYLRETRPSKDSLPSHTIGGGTTRLIESQGFEPDEIEAVLSDLPTRIDLLLPRLHALQEFRKLPQAAQLAAANKRVKNILKKSVLSAGVAREDRMDDAAEKTLYRAIGDARGKVETAAGNGSYATALSELAALAAPIDVFFEQVLVNHADPAIRDNRLRMLAELERLLNKVADISKLAPEK